MNLSFVTFPSHFISTSFTTAGYGSHQNVFIRLDPLGRPPSATGSYATIASLNKYPAESKKSCSIFDRKLSVLFLVPSLTYRSPNYLFPYRVPQLAHTHTLRHRPAANGRPGWRNHLLKARIRLSLENILLRLLPANPGEFQSL